MLKKRKIYILYGLVFICTAIIMPYFISEHRNTAIKIVGIIVNKNEYKYFVEKMKIEYYKEFGYYVDGMLADFNEREEFWKSQVKGKKAIDSLKEDALLKVQEFAFLLQNSKELGIKLNDEDEFDIRIYFDSLIDEYKGEAILNRELERTSGISLKEYKSVYRKEKLAEKVRQQIKSQIEVIDADVRDFYSNNRDKVDKVKIKNILLMYPENLSNTNGKTDIELMGKALEIQDTIKSGADMDELVEKYSDDQFSKAQRGEYIFSRDGLVLQNLEDWAFSAEIGEIGVVKTGLGYHILRLEERTGYEEVKEEANEAFLEYKFELILNDWINSPKFKVEINESIIEGVNIVI